MRKIVLLFVLLTSVVVSSCSKSDKNNPFIGTWSCKNHYWGGDQPGDGIDTYVFKKDLSYSWSITFSSSGHYSEPASGNYYYNPELGTLTLSNANNTRVFIVLSLTDDFFVIESDSSCSYTYYKQK